MADDATKTTDDTTTSKDDSGKTTDESKSESSSDTWQAPKSQAELDAIIKDRLARERGKYKDYDDLKRKAGEYDKLADSQKSDMERLTGDRDNWKSQAEQHSAKALKALRKSAVVAEAARQGAANPSLIFSLVDQDSLEVDGDDNVSGVTEAVKALLDNEPYLRGSKVKNMNPNDVDGGTRTDGSGTPGTFTRTQIRDPNFYRQHEKEILAAQKAGLILNE